MHQSTDKTSRFLDHIRIDRIHTEPIQLREPFLEYAARFASMPGTVLLMSGGKLDCAAHHILGFKPWLTLLGKGGKMEIRAGNQVQRFEADPFETLQSVLTRFRQKMNLTGPFSSGLLGYLAYDLKDHLEKLPRTSMDDQGLPDIYMTAPSIIVVHTKETNDTQLCIPVRKISGRTTLEADLDFYQDALSRSPVRTGFSGNVDNMKSGFTRDEYIGAVEKIIDYIRSGHVYQVNMSQRFTMPFRGDPYALFQKLYQKNPAPFFAYIQAGDHQVVSTSPERFIKQTDQHLETRPIKGTRPRGKTDIEDRKFRSELEDSKKDDAELSMIVDLLRNDIGKVCQGGTVRVTRHKRLEAYENVYHLVSTVEGRLRETVDAVDVIRAVFPGGSITGCPKIRSMEIIDELEPVRRHIYTGAIGYIGFHDTMDLSIAIRTATVHGGRLCFSVGGGIVYDSDPSMEFEETLHKGRTLITVLGNEKTRENPLPFVWMNGKIIPSNQALFPASDLGLQYGFGFFETIRASDGCTGYLDKHVERFNHSWKTLFQGPPPDLSWDIVIKRVLESNGLNHGTAAVKIMATMGDRTIPPLNHTVLVMARPYIHRLENNIPFGIDLAVYPEPRQSDLADHKTLNYLYYLLAGNWAKNQSFDEALILNPDGSVSETNTANVILIQNGRLIHPESPHVLPGIMEQAVTRLLNKQGYSSVTRKILPRDFYSADTVLLTNSLMGAVPVLSLDGKKLKPASDLWKEINEAVL